MKNFVKGMMSAALIGSMLMSVAGCTSFNLIEYDDFAAALEEEVGLKEDDCRTGKNKKRNGYEMKRYIEGTKGTSTTFKYYEFKDEDDAVEFFEKQYDEFLDVIEDEDFEGSHKESFDEDSATGYILIDGEADNSSVYGGIYLKENTYITVATTGSQDKDRDRVDAVLSAIGYPKP